MAEDKDFKITMEKLNKWLWAHVENMNAYNWHYAERTWQKTKIADAIKGIDELSHMVCDDGSCGSIFCMACRDNKRRSLHKQLDGRYQRFANDEDARDNFRYVTILHELVPISFDGIIAEHASQSDIARSVSSFRAQIKSIDRYFKKHNLWARGTIHIELINMELFRSRSLSGHTTIKQKTLRDMEEDTGKFADYYALVHAHILFDTNGLDDKKFGMFLRKKWRLNHRQVDITRLTKYYIDGERFTKHTVPDAIKNIANYGYNGSNGRLTYATNWGSSRKVYSKASKLDALGRIIEYVKGVKGLDGLDQKLSKGEIRFLIKAHNQFTDNNGRGLLVSIQ
jgi:hypothetical protein